MDVVVDYDRKQDSSYSRATLFQGAKLLQVLGVIHAHEQIPVRSNLAGGAPSKLAVELNISSREPRQDTGFRIKRKPRS
jgi:hypothetical protein